MDREYDGEIHGSLAWAALASLVFLTSNTCVLAASPDGSSSVSHLTSESPPQILASLPSMSAAAATAATTAAASSPSIKVIRGKPDLKEVALTIDDGPIDTTATDYGTKAVLAALASENITATFFLVGDQAREFPALVRAIRDAGHSIGNHTKDHAQNVGMLNLSPKEREQEIVEGKKMIEDALGTGPISMPLFRLPQGSGFRDIAINQLIGKYHKYNCFWSVDTEDWKGAGENQTVDVVVKSNQLEGSVILCHDIAKGTPNAIRRFGRELKSRGYKFVTLEKLLEDSKGEMSQ